MRACNLGGGTERAERARNLTDPGGDNKNDDRCESGDLQYHIYGEQGFNPIKVPSASFPITAAKSLNA